MVALSARSRARRALGAAWSAATSTASHRETYLALAEYMARAERPHEPGGPARPLAGCELRVFSQNGEDGVIGECLRRLGPGSATFAEFGAGQGSENNCLLLADVLGWRGLFADGDPASVARLEAKYDGVPGVEVRHAVMTAATVERVLTEAGVPDDLDVLSIDVDGADYWLWAALRRIRPRIVVVEYNASLGPHVVAVQPEHEAGNRGTDYFGASVRALLELGRAKGYRLVHTDLTGANAFFVRDDLGGDWPAEADVALRGANYFLGARGHDPDPAPGAYVSPVAADVVGRDGAGA